MLVQDGCGACAEAKEILKDQIKQKKIVILETLSEKGLELVKKYEVESVPTIINNKNGFEQKCYLSKDADKIFCEDGTEKKLIKKED